jgi:hypothetical protein
MASRNRYAFTRLIENQSAVPALDAFCDHSPKREQRATMAASIASAVTDYDAFSEEYDWLTRNSARQRSVAGLIGPGGDITCIPDERPNSPYPEFLCAMVGMPHS